MSSGPQRREKPGVSRRGFITSMGAGVVGTAALGARPAEAAPTAVVAADEPVPLALRVNGSLRRVAVEPRTTLLEVLRGPLGLTGAKPACERGECGACTVLVGGQPRYACMMLALEAEGAEVTTVEGLLDGETLGPVQQAFVEKDGFQCGFCTSGQVMAVEGLLRKQPDPSPAEIREAVSGNLCRCGAYAHIFEAARRAGELKRGGGR
ncbi:MAG TPA: (2Fe-2S)-binding protein [Vicinamibacteria bacterium]|nr:(2Fe-2S)-binding protein [Vicinamibacteria bacterium]